MSETLFDALFETAPAEPNNPVARAQTLSRAALPKRFYQTVSVRAGEAGFEILLDARLVRTPGRSPLTVPSQRIADAIAGEWQAQTAEINPATMPITRITNAAIDGVAETREAVARDIARFAGSDLLCYRAEDPERLIERQTETWDPIIKRFETRLGVRFHLAGGIMPVEQDSATLEAVLAAVRTRSSLQLAALHTLTALTGSVILALSVADDGLDFEEAWSAAHLDEDWNRELWGNDAEADRRRTQRHTEAAAAALLLEP